MAEYVYEPFADTEEYRDVNTTIVKEWIQMMVDAGARHIDRLVDLATGVGTMVEIFLDNLPSDWKQPTVTCVDKSPEALEQTRKRLGDRVERLELIESPIEDLDLPENSADVAMWGNGIHYLTQESQEKALLRVRRVLTPNGWLLFNSAFYADSRPEETLPFYRAQISNAVRKLRSLGVGRQDKTGRPQAGTFPDQAHYQWLLQQAGFGVEEMKKVVARLYKSAWENISGFSQYAAGALHGYQTDIAAKVLREAVEPSLEQHGFRDEQNRLYIPRNWLAAAARPRDKQSPA
ncbi:MAG: class I SAM-dependent methyltransferase [Spirochaetota bacterium]